jgi:ubiquinone/menaquinone biosynthesis C-methylase UbiE
MKCPMKRTLVQSQFGAHAAAYAASAVHAHGWSLERLVALLAPQPGERALDIATGAGHTAAALAPLVDSVVASDITQEMLTEAAKLARKRDLANMQIAVADAEQLPFPARSFDIVVCRLAAHHFPQPQRFVAEAARVLKRGGRFGLVDNIAPDSEVLHGATAAEVEATAQRYNAFEKLRDPSHGRALALGEWREVIAAAGLVVTAAEWATKDMDFADYVRRMGCDEATRERLAAELTSGPGPLRAFLAPRESEGGLTFHLHEAVIVAKKGD